MIDLALQYLTSIAQSMLLLFVVFVVLADAKTRAEGTQIYPALRLVFGVPFVIADCIVNYQLSILLLDLPAHPFELVTGRLSRYKKTYSMPLRHMQLTKIEAFRYRFAVFVCRRLNRYDADHC